MSTEIGFSHEHTGASTGEETGTPLGGKDALHVGYNDDGSPIKPDQMRSEILGATFVNLVDMCVEDNPKAVERLGEDLNNCVGRTIKSVEWITFPPAAPSGTLGFYRLNLEPKQSFLPEIIGQTEDGVKGCGSVLDSDKFKSDLGKIIKRYTDEYSHLKHPPGHE